MSNKVLATNPGKSHLGEAARSPDWTGGKACSLFNKLRKIITITIAYLFIIYMASIYKDWVQGMDRYKAVDCDSHKSDVKTAKYLQ